MLPASEIPSDEAPTRRLDGFAGRLATALAIGLSLYALYWVLFIVQPQVYRVSFLLIALILTFLLFPAFAKAPASLKATADKRAGPPSPRLRRASDEFPRRTGC